ncbi:MAG: hypothetical protein IT374_16470 [Polyangiaceae bacterium]|nr:hypothetical protein [Polyangiaceae bacterium]
MSDAERDTDVLLLLMAVAPQWEEVERVRTTALATLSPAYGAEIADALSMAAAELVENGVKYGAGDVIVAVRELPGAVEVSVTNDTASADVLLEKIGWIRGCASPEDAYRQALEGVVLAGVVQSGGLGLVRIVYEGGCELSVDQQGGRVTVRARRPTPPRGVS